MPIYAEKTMRYAHLAGICEKCGNMRNMQQSPVRVKLACLIKVILVVTCNYCKKNLTV